MRPQRNPRRQRLMTAGLLGGGAAGLLLLAPSLADAASPLADAFGQTTPPTTEPAADTADDPADEPAADPAAEDELVIFEPGEQLRELLQPLVDDGTITVEQLEAVIESVQSAAPDVFVEGMPPIFESGPGPHGRPDMQFPDMQFPDGAPGFPDGGIEIHGGGPGIAVEVGGDMGPGAFPGVGPYALDLVANTIGITAPDLIDQLADGSTVAEIATAAGADPQAVIDALVADAQERLAAAVQSGRITQAVADERIEEATERITNFVNGEAPSTDGTESSEAGAAESTEETADTTAPSTTTA